MRLSRSPYLLYHWLREIHALYFNISKIFFLRKKHIGRPSFINDDSSFQNPWGMFMLIYLSWPIRLGLVQYFKITVFPPPYVGVKRWLGGAGGGGGYICTYFLACELGLLREGEVWLHHIVPMSLVSLQIRVALYILTNKPLAPSKWLKLKQLCTFSTIFLHRS